MWVDLAHDELAMVDYSRTGRILLVSDDPATLRSVEAAGERCSCRLLRTTTASAAAWLDEPGGFEGLFLAVTPANLADALPLLGHLADAGEDAGFRSWSAHPPG
jgi:hypothetical protein